MQYTITIKGKEHGTGTFSECMEELMMIYGQHATCADVAAQGVVIQRA